MIRRFLKNLLRDSRSREVPLFDGWDVIHGGTSNRVTTRFNTRCPKGVVEIWTWPQSRNGSNWWSLGLGHYRADDERFPGEMFEWQRCLSDKIWELEIPGIASILFGSDGLTVFHDGTWSNRTVADVVATKAILPVLEDRIAEVLRATEGEPI